MEETVPRVLTPYRIPLHPPTDFWDAPPWWVLSALVTGEMEIVTEVPWITLAWRGRVYGVGEVVSAPTALAVACRSTTAE